MRKDQIREDETARRTGRTIQHRFTKDGNGDAWLRRQTSPAKGVQNSFFATLNRNDVRSQEKLKKAVSDAALLRQHLNSFDLEALKTGQPGHKSSTLIAETRPLRSLKDLTQHSDYLKKLQTERRESEHHKIAPTTPIQKARNIAAELVRRQKGHKGYSSRRASVSSESSLSS